jgi:hypothetical protein
VDVVEHAPDVRLGCGIDFGGETRTPSDLGAVAQDARGFLGDLEERLAEESPTGANAFKEKPVFGRTVMKRECQQPRSSLLILALIVTVFPSAPSGSTSSSMTGGRAAC